MKKLFKQLWLMVALAVSAPAVTMAQGMPPIPVDTAVVIGKLPNGLTYYVRHNDYPKGQADFYIAQKVGSILEEENQRGLAHFLEHMCFNGTKNFPGNEVVSWLESIGVKFGAHLNAYTAVDQTVYNITNVPTARESVQDSCLLILHDWANELLLDPEEIDKERGVIHEEWRRSMTGQMRILEDALPKMYPGSRYGQRLPIGTMEVVDNFPYQALRDYYERWYRPDQQGIVVVGDIDPVRIEAKIKEMFSDIEMPADAPERVYFPVEDNKGTIFAIGRDKEMSNALIMMMFKFDPVPEQMKGTAAYLVYDYMTDMLQMMLNSRFGEMMSKPETPFAYASADIGEFFMAKTKESLSVTGAAKGNDLLPTAESIYREVLRAKRGGFTASEYERARDEYMSRLEKMYNNRNTQETGTYVHQYLNHFLDNEPIPSIDWLYAQMQTLTKLISVNEINQMMQEIVTDDNRVVLAMMPEKDDFKFPSDSEMEAVMKAVDAEEIVAFVDNVKSEPLIPSLPAAGKVVATGHNAMWDAEEWTLSNGVKVLIKPTKFKDDEILMTAVANGGMATALSTIDPASYQTMSLVLESFGINDYTNSDLQKYLQGKQVGVSPNFGSYTRTVSASTTPKDLPVMMEVLYGVFTGFNVSADEFKALQELYVGLIQNQEANPQYVFSRDLYKALYKSPYRQATSVDDVKNANREVILNTVHAQLANAADYTFIFVGNVDPEALKPLVEQYVATLPADPSKVQGRVAKSDPALSITPGAGMDNFTTKMENPQTWVAIIESGSMPYTSRDAKLADIAGQILTTRLIETVREKEGAVYSINASGYVSSPEGMNAGMQSVFPMKPEMKEKVLGMIKQEFDNMTTNVTDAELNKVKEFLVKMYTENRERNNPWRAAMSGYITTGIDSFNGNIETVNSITVADVMDFMKRLNGQGNYRVVILDPAE